MIEINKKGKILEGKHIGWYVLVKDDTDNSGGFYIFMSKNENFTGGLDEGYDSWLEDAKLIENYFEVAKWKIEWLE